MISIRYNMGGNCGNSSYLWSYSHFLLICDHQDTEYESQEVEMGVAETIFTQKIYKRLYGKTISILYNMGEKYSDNYPFFGARSISLLFYVHQKTDLG